MNKNFILKICLLCTILLPFSLFGNDNPRGSLKGIVKNSNNEVLQSATVFITKDTSLLNIITSKVTDNSGRFEIELPEGAYTLGVSYIGYEGYSRMIEIKNGKTTDIGIINLAESQNELQTVVIQGKFIRVKTQPDGFSVNVEELRKKSNDALDLLRQLPNINVKGADITVIGKKNIIVKIGNVLQRVPASEVASILKGYDAALIQKVEVLMHPPLRYDTDGNTAMIILHTSDTFKNYFGGIIGSEIMVGENHNGRAGIYGSLLYNKNKLSISISPSINYNPSGSKEDLSYVYNNKTYHLLTPSKGDYTYKGIRSNIQYQYSKRGIIGILTSLSRSKRNNIFESIEQTFPASHTTIDANNHNENNSNEPKFTSTAYFEQGFGARNNKVWLELSYYHISDRNNTDYIGRRIINNIPFFKYQDDDNVKISGLIFNNDYSIYFDDAKKFQLDGGIKAVWNTTKNYRFHNQEYINNSAETYKQENEIKVTELGINPYLSSTLSFSKKIWMRVGLRLATSSNEIYLTNKPDTSLLYSRLLPSLHTTYTFSSRHKLFFNFNSAIEYPKFKDINPFEWKINQKNILRGNIRLIPETSYTFDAGYTYKGALSVYTKLRYRENVISPISSMENDVICTQTENAQRERFFGLNLDYYFDDLDWMTFSMNSYYGKNNYTALNSHLQKHSEGYEWGVSGYMDFTFNKSRTFNGYIEGSYVGKKHTPIAVIEPQYNMGIGFAYALFNKKMYISLSLMNIITSAYKGQSDRNGYTIHFNNRYDYPTLYFSISYKFSNVKDFTNTRQSNATREVERRF